VKPDVSTSVPLRVAETMLGAMMSIHVDAPGVAVNVAVVVLVNVS
jgi:hypothetical protein